jgi:hypothetical protein
MSVEKFKINGEVYSGHRYIDSSGIPDYEKIFSRGSSEFWVQNHLDGWLIKHLENQPDIIKEDKFINGHLRDCSECSSFLEQKEPDEEQQDLDFREAS